MKQWMTLIGVCVLWCGAARGFAAEATNKADVVKAGDEQSWAGKFSWNGKKGQKHDLKAVFKPEDNGSWSVEFKAKWNNKDMVYRGTVKGDLKSGEVSGEAKDSGGKRTWTFKGTVKDGVLDCKHTETTKGKETPTGDFSLKKV